MTTKSSGQPDGNLKIVLLTVNRGLVFFFIAVSLSFILYIAGNWKGWSEETLFTLLYIVSISSIVLFLLSTGDFVLNTGLIFLEKETRRLKLILVFVLSALFALAPAIFSIAIIVISEGNLR